MKSRKSWKSTARLCGGVLLVSLMAGCTTHTTKFADVRKNYVAHNFDEALKITSKEIKSQKDGNDALLWKMEHATILRAKGDFAKSETAFEVVREKYAENLDAAKTRLLRGTVDLLTSPANAPYWGAGYDGIMIDTYQALNALQLGKPDDARIYLRRSYLLQEEIAEYNAVRIEKERAKAEEDKAAKEALSENEKAFEVDMGELEDVSAEIKAYGSYINPFAVYLDGLFNYAQGDVENARFSLKKVNAFVPQNSAVKVDYEAAEAGQALQPSVYVIFETGMAPHLVENRVDIVLPTYLINILRSTRSFPTLVSFSLAYPQLKTSSSYVSQLMAGDATTERVVSMDAVIGREFQDNYSSVMTKAIASATIKAAAVIIAQVAVVKGLENRADIPSQMALKAAVAVVMTVINKATTVADTRSWQTLPKEIQVAKCDMPGNRRLSLATPGGWRQDVALIEGDVVVVYVKAITSRPVSVNQFKLR